MTEQLYDIVEAVQALRIHPDTIRRMIKDGLIRAAKIGNKYRIRQSEIDRLLQDSK